MRMFQRIILLTAVLCFVGSLCAFAAPDTIATDAAGNTYDLIMITNPQNQKDSTFSSSYIVSGHGKEGTAVTLYRYDAGDNVFKKLYNEIQYIDSEGVSQKAYSEATVTIGASGLFMNTVVLNQGTNSMLIRAENGDKVQLMKVSLTKYSYNLFDIIKSLTKQ